MQRNKINDIILDNMQEQVYARDLDMNIIYINPASEKLTGWTLKDALGQKCYDIFGDEKQTCKDVCPIEKMIADKMPIYHHEGKLKTRYGDEKDMKVSISPLLENDSVTGAVVVMNDITYQKKIEQTNVKSLIALSQEKKMLVKGPVVVFKWKNNPGWSVEYVSDNVKNLIGYSAEEWNLQKINYADIIFKKDKQRVTDEVVENSESGANHFDHKPYRLVKKDGTIIWVLDYTTIIRDKAGDITHYHGYLMDITKAKQTHEKLKKNETRLEIEKQKSDEYISIAGVMLLIIDTDENITLMNKKGYEILGYNKGELIGKNWFDTFVPGKTRKELKGVFQRLISGDIEPVEYYENQLLTKDGKEITISFHNTILRDSNGNITGTLSSGEDITERKYAENALRESEEKYRLLAESMNDVIVQLSPTGELLYVSPNVKEFGGYDPESEIGNDLSKYFANDTDIIRAVELLEKVLETHESGSFEFLFKPKDKKPFYVEHTYFPIVKDNKVTAIQLVLRDVTERKESEAALKKASQEWTLAMNAFEDIIYLLDNDRCVVQANSAFYKSMDITPDKAIGKHIVEIIHPQGEDKPCPVCLAQEEKRDYVTIMEADAPNNPAKRPIEITVKIVRNEDGTPSGILMNLHDLTTARADEQKLLDSEKQLNTLMNATTDIACLAKSDGTLLAGNNALAKSLGVEREELINHSMYGFASREDAEKRKLIIQKGIESKKPFQWKDDRAGKYFDNFVYPILDDKGDVKQIAVFARDITEKVKAEETLRQYEHIISATNDHMSFLDQDYTYQAVNDAYLTAHTKERSQIIGRTVPDVLGTEMFEQIVKEKLDSCFVGEEIQYQDWFNFPGLGKRYMDVTYYPYTGPDGSVSGVVVSSHDITTSIEAEQELKYSKLQLEAVFNNLDSIIYITDMDSYEILYINDYMKKVFGNDLTGKICWKSIHKDQNGPCAFCTNNKLIDADGNPKAAPYVWEFYNQQLKRWYEMHNLAITWTDGNLVRMEIATDITLRKKTEYQQNNIKERLEEKIKERTSSLEDVNIALKVLLKKGGDDKDQIGENIYANFKAVIQPLINQLRIVHANSAKEKILDIIESSIKEMIAPFAKKLSDPLLGLTPTEIQIAVLVKGGKTNKEIAQILNKSIRAISAHRENIRQKFGLKKTKINLRSYLLSIK